LFNTGTSFLNLVVVNLTVASLDFTSDNFMIFTVFLTVFDVVVLAVVGVVGTYQPHQPPHQPQP
jgi:hypothetical protein